MHIPVLLLTGAFEPFDQERARKAGCDGFLAKPFEPQTLIAKVRELLAAATSAAPAEQPPVVAPPASPPPEAPASSGGNSTVEILASLEPAPPQALPPAAPTLAAVPPPIDDGTVIDESFAVEAGSQGLRTRRGL